MTQHSEVHFGFLDFQESLKVGSYSIEPLDNFAAIREEVLNSTDLYDKFLYPPPLCHRPRPDLFLVPASHRIICNEGCPEKETFCRGEGKLIVHLLAMIFQTRLQFVGVNMDGRVLIEPEGIAVFDADLLQKNIERVLRSWTDWEEKQRNLYITALYLHNRATSYHWSWERFWWEYTVLDTCCKIMGCREKKVSHPERLSYILGRFHMARDPDFEQRIVDLRNEFVHEGLWDGGTPGYGHESGKSPSAEQCTKILTWLLLRLLLAVGGVKSGFIKRSWVDRNPALLDAPK